MDISDPIWPKNINLVAFSTVKHKIDNVSSIKINKKIKTSHNFSFQAFLGVKTPLQIAHVMRLSKSFIHSAKSFKFAISC